MEPPDLFERYLDPKFRHRVLGPIGADGKPKRGTSAQTIIDGLPGTGDADMQQHRKRLKAGGTQSTQPLSGSRLADTGRLDFAIKRNYDPEAQVMGMAMEGVDIAVLYPTNGPVAPRAQRHGPRSSRWPSARPTTTGSPSSAATARSA